MATVNVGVREGQKARIEEYTKKHPDKYTSINSFVQAAIDYFIEKQTQADYESHEIRDTIRDIEEFCEYLLESTLDGALLMSNKLETHISLLVNSLKEYKYEITSYKVERIQMLKTAIIVKRSLMNLDDVLHDDSIYPDKKLEEQILKQSEENIKDFTKAVKSYRPHD